MFHTRNRTRPGNIPIDVVITEGVNAVQTRFLTFVPHVRCAPRWRELQWYLGPCDRRDRRPTDPSATAMQSECTRELRVARMKRTRRAKPRQGNTIPGGEF